MKFFILGKFTLVILLIDIVCGVKTGEIEIISEKSMVYSNATNFLQGKGKLNIKCS